MPAQITNNNKEISDRSSHREARISPSLPTPLPLKHVILSSGSLKQRDHDPPSKPSTVRSAEIASFLQRALDLMESSDYWSDFSDDDEVAQ
jgi:hypothetical protein